jgi:hypothetical protein
VHIGGFNLGLLMRTLIGAGTPRGLQGRLAALITLVMTLRTRVVDSWRYHQRPSAHHSAGFTPNHRFGLFTIAAPECGRLATGC